MNSQSSIRSVTLGVPTVLLGESSLEEQLTKFYEEAKQASDNFNIKINTNRITLQPMTLENNRFSSAYISSSIKWVQDVCDKVGVRWFCVPFSFLDSVDKNEVKRCAFETLSKHPNTFVNIIVSDETRIDKRGVLLSSELIQEVSRYSSNGYDNFRLGISSGCKPNTPFFPFSYHAPNMDEPGFSLAMEVVDLFIEEAIKNKSGGLKRQQESMSLRLQAELHKINEFGESLSSRTGIKYLGIDASLAPYPNKSTSVARLVELLLNDDFGCFRTVHITSVLTNIIKSSIAKAQIKSVGFNGVMYSPLEDDYLADANNKKQFGLDSLMLYSTVCGCGLDMVPLPGDVSKDEISSLIFDISSLAMVHKKPLGTRVLPIPRKAGNEVTDFNHDFFVDTRVMKLKNSSPMLSDAVVGEFEYLDL